MNAENPTDMQTEMETIRAMQVKADLAKRRASQAQKSVSNRWEKLANRLKKGETTGDPILDFVIVRYGGIEERFLTVFRQLQERLKGMTGQYVMLVEREPAEKDEHVFPSVEFPKPEEMRLGILKAERLEFNLKRLETLSLDGNWGCCLPTDSYVSLRVNSSDEPKSVESHLHPRHHWNDFGWALSTDAEVQGHYKSSGHELEVLIGNDEVKDWFVRRSSQSLMNPERYLMIFWEMSRLLSGPTLDLPGLEEFLSRRRAEIKERLDVLCTRRGYLSSLIASIEGQLERGSSTVVVDGHSDRMEPDKARRHLDKSLRPGLEKVDKEIGAKQLEAGKLGLGQTN